MKAFLLFIVFILGGIAIVTSIHYWSPQKLLPGSKQQITTHFSLNDAPSDSLKGEIASLSGSVSWLSRTASKSVPLKSPQEIQQGEEISTGSNGKVIIAIKNIAAFSLEPNTHVGIIQLLPQNFVFLQVKGTAQYENTIQVPVSIKTLDLVTLLAHGALTATVDTKNQKVTIAVLKGTAQEAYEDSQNNSTVATLNQGQTYVFDETNKVGSIQ